MPGDVHPAYTRAALSHLWAFPVVVSAAQRRFALPMAFIWIRALLSAHNVLELAVKQGTAG